MLPNISLDRLELSKKYGGINLKRILSIFSASKSKTIMRSFEEKNKNKPCYILLKQMMEKIYDNQPKNNFIHPFFYTNAENESYRNNNNIWKWYNQAAIIHSSINKTSTYYPSTIGDNIWDMEKDIVYNLHSQELLKKYTPKQNTIKVILLDNDSKNYENILYNNYYQNTFKRTKFRDWNKHKICYVNYEEMKQKKLTSKSQNKEVKINLNLIFKLYNISCKEIPLWTEKQKDWIYKGFNLPKLFNHNIKTISRIDDYRYKILSNYWHFMSHLNSTCPLCLLLTKFNTEHILNECLVVKNWEEEIYGEEIRNIRINSLFNINKNHTFAWIYTWCIWKNFWEIFYSDSHNNDYINDPISNFRKHLKMFEYIHLKLIIKTRISKNFDDEIQFFQFYSIEDEEIIPIQLIF